MADGYIQQILFISIALFFLSSITYTDTSQIHKDRHTHTHTYTCKTDSYHGITLFTIQILHQILKRNLQSAFYADTQSPLRHCKPSPSTSPWPDVHLHVQFCNFSSPSIRQYIAVYFVGSSMLTLDSRWIRNPLRRIFQLQ